MYNKEDFEELLYELEDVFQDEELSEDQLMQIAMLCGEIAGRRNQKINGSKWMTTDQAVGFKEELKKAPTHYSTKYTGNNSWSVTIPVYKPIPLDNSVPKACKKRCGSIEKEEGKNPMAYNSYSAPTAVAAISAIDPTVEQRAYLRDRAKVLRYSKRDELPGMFNLYVNNAPKTYKELIETIKNGKFKLDEKKTKLIDEAIEDGDRWYVNGPFDGIIWDGPQPDHDGYSAANEALESQFTKVVDAINILDPKDGLAALQAFEAWVPTGKAN